MRNLHLITSDSETFACQNHPVATLIHEVFGFSSIYCKICAFDARAVDEKASYVVTGDLTNESIKELSKTRCMILTFKVRRGVRYSGGGSPPW